MKITIILQLPRQEDDDDDTLFFIYVLDTPDRL